MKRIAIIVMMLIGCLIHPNIVKANEIKDAFVLVDVSGTMRHAPNSEARQIINKMLQRNFRLSDYPGWSLFNGRCPFSPNDGKSLIDLGGKVCIVPFGNQGTMEDSRFVETSDFNKSFDSLFPTRFNDSATFLTLAKAYIVDLASKNNIYGTVYMVIYTDGMGDHMQEQVWDKYERIYQDYGVPDKSLAQKIGTLKKESNGNKYYIEMWELGPIRNIVKIDTPESVVDSKKIEISNQPNGKSPKSPIEINVEEPFTIRWKNASGKTGVNVQIKKGDAYTNIPVNDRDNYYTLEKKANSATITVYEAQDYKIIVGDSNGRDERYISVKSNWISDLFPIIVIVILVIGGVLLWRLLSKPKTNNSSGWNTNNGNSRNNNTNHKDDW